MPAAGRPVTILDAGSSNGLSSLLFAEFLGFQGEVIALDADENSAAAIQTNTAHVAAITRVHAVIVSGARAAAAKREKPDLRPLPSRKSAGQGTAQVLDADGSQPVPALSLLDVKVCELPSDNEGI